MFQLILSLLDYMSKHYLEIEPTGHVSYSFPIMTRYRLLYTIFMCCGWLLFVSDVIRFQVHM